MLVPPRLIGRDAELCDLQARLSAGARLISVVGPAGVGKTALAATLAAGSGALWCGLDSATPGGDWAAHVLSALGATGREADSAAALLAALQARGALLLVLDNFETVLTPSARMVAEWLERCPELTLLVTSRERLRLKHEQVVELSPLPTAPGVELLLERARAHNSAAFSSPGDAELAASIVERVDGLPLSIELSAARAVVLGPRELWVRLQEPLAVLASRQRDGRALSLEEAIDASWIGLDAEQQRALCACSVFRGGFDVTAAEALIGPGALDALTALREKSLVAQRSADGGPRLLLLEGIRQYADAKLDDSAAQERHAQFYAVTGMDWMRRARRGDRHAWACIQAERDNLHAVVERGVSGAVSPAAAAGALVALEPLYTQRGPFSPYLEMLDRFEGAIAGAVLPAALSAELSLCRAVLEVGWGHWIRGHRALGRALELARAAGDQQLTQYCAIKHAATDAMCGHIEEASAALAALDIRDDPWLSAHCLRHRAFVVSRTGDVEASLELLRQALQELARAPDPREESFVLAGMGNRHLDAGRLDAAASCLRAAVEKAEAVGDDRLAAMSLSNLGSALAEQGRFDEAAQCYEAALSTLSRYGDRHLLASLESNYGDVCALRGQLVRARERYRRADEIVGAGSVSTERAVICARLGAAAAWCDDLAEAEHAFERAREIAATTAEVDRRAVELFELSLDLARARAAQRAGRRQDAEARLASVSGVLQAARTQAGVADHRVALQLAEAQLSDLSRLVRVARDGSSFVTPSGERVDLRRRRALPRILARLAEQPGRPVHLDALVDAGWPGERLLRRAAEQRLYKAIETLRRLGLGEALATHGDGYTLVEVTIDNP